MHMRDDAATRLAKIQAHTLRDAPTMIERVWPSTQISIEAEQERDAKQSQTLTPLGAYWKGRKPLVLVRACVLGALLPATNNPERDLATFEALMAFDENGMGHRAEGIAAADLSTIALQGSASAEELSAAFVNRLTPNSNLIDEWSDAIEKRRVGWRRDLNPEERRAIIGKWVSTLPYKQRVELAARSEHLDDDAFDHIWNDVNEHLGTTARSIPELVNQLGVMRFGEKPHVVDTFSGGGSIPFEAARTGCRSTGTDLNPIACMLSWGAGHIIGASNTDEAEWKRSQEHAAREISARMQALGFEHDADGNQTKAFLYCLETRCPQTGWMVPMLPTLVISKAQGVVARLVPEPEHQRYAIEIDSGVGPDRLKAAALGTVQGDNLVHSVGGETYRTSLKSLRGLERGTDGSKFSKLRLWSKTDVAPRPDDVFQERLYAILWMRRGTVSNARPQTFFASVKPEDVRREDEVRALVETNIVEWQAAGLIPDMAIEAGAKTSEPIRTRGWTHWHHLFTPRQLHFFALCREVDSSPIGAIALARVLDRSSKLNRWSNNNGSTGQPTNVFSNQALNTMLNYGSYASRDYLRLMEMSSAGTTLQAAPTILNQPASALAIQHHLGITDPPYADAVNYHEITEFFIAWLRKQPPNPFDQWVWDSRRPLAIKGEGEEFRREMVAAYSALAKNMPNNGLQIVMFTHQSGAVWADMAQIFWGAGLQVQAAWYIATETSTELRKGGHVQGTVILVLRKRNDGESGYEDEIAQEVRGEVARQIDTLVGLNQQLKGAGRVENLFEDADLQMAGYAAALRVLTGYTRIDGRDMTAEAGRPRKKGEQGFVERIIDYAVQVANEHMVPTGLTPRLWQSLSGTERFYLKMVDLEAAGLSKLDNYQNFARAFRVPDYGVLMADLRPNTARIKGASDFKRRTGFEIPNFGEGLVRAVLYGIWELSAEIDPDVVTQQLHEMVDGYYRRREDLIEIAEYIASQRGREDQKEGRYAALLANILRNEKL
ncbi:anti-phage-associated DUF1156 domain-containing protein [Sphingomonas aracearum]|nr:anti-phage-associated DUF1156 domain-containing protein [Sphingomonas aracearum]